MIRKNIANEAQGRAWGIIGVISQLGYVVAYALAGILSLVILKIKSIRVLEKQ